MSTQLPERIEPNLPPDARPVSIPEKTTSTNSDSNVTVRREIDRLARQTEGISKALKRVRDSLTK